jgi:hypothetical protein
MSATTILTFSVCLLGQIAADSRSEQAELVAAWLKVSLAQANDYVIYFPGRQDQPLELIPKPVFRHSQPVRGDDIGAVYLWVDGQKRPAVIGTTFGFSIGGGVRSMAHEFHSLADTPLETTWRGATYWRPATPGVSWQPIPGAPEPAESPATKLRQVRTLARRFSAHSIDHSDGRWELRLISQPIYRYADTQSPVSAGGAVFVFCQGTDPEIVLMIEARRVEDLPNWCYACAAFSDYKLYVQLNGQEVWNVTEQVRSPNAPLWWWHEMSKERLPDEE